MNPEAEGLRHALLNVGSISDTGRRWLFSNADTVAELVDAAMEVSWWATANHPDAEWVNHRLRRLARAVVDFKGPQEPPEPRREHVPTLRCPECDWYRRIENIEFTAVQLDNEAYRRHYRDRHQGGKP